MKRWTVCFIGVLLCLLVASSPTRGQQVSFLENLSWQELILKAQEADKPIFVDVYTSWCAPCKRMETSVFSNANVADYVNRTYLSIRLDAEKEKSHGFFTRFHPGAYPSFYWLDKDGRLLSTESGYLPADNFLNRCREARTSSLWKQLEDCRQKWAAGVRDEAFVDKYLFEVLPQACPDSVRPYFNLYLAELTPDELKSARIGRHLCRFTRSIQDDKVWSTLLQYNDVYSSVLDSSVDFDRLMYMNLVRIPVAVRSDETSFRKYLNLIESQSFPNKALYDSLLRMELKVFDGNYREALNQALSIGDEYEGSHPYLYREMFYTFIIGKFFLDAYDPSDAERRAILALAGKAFKLTPSKSTVSYLAAAYARNGDYRKAYETLAILPFHKEPTLSNAVYSLLNLPLKR